MIKAYLFQGQLLRDSLILHFLDFFHELVHLELLLLLQVLFQLCLLMLELQWELGKVGERIEENSRWIK